MAKLTIKQVMDMQEHFIKAGIMRDPNSYSAEELKYLNPRVPPDFIDDHVAVRDGKKKESDWQKIKVNLDKI